MTIIRQGSLFNLQDLYDLEPTQRFEAIFSAIDINPILAVLRKTSCVGRPVELNYAAMIYSLVARISERIPFVNPYSAPERQAVPLFSGACLKIWVF